MAKEVVKAKEPISVQEQINALVQKAKKAQEEYLKLDQEQIDNIVQAMALAGADRHMVLAKMAIEETGRGVYEDKITKNLFATEYIYHSKSRIVAMSFCEPRSWTRVLSS